MDEETISLKLPKDALEFIEFYAELGGMDRDTLLTKILTERIKEVRDKFKAMPYMNIPETF